MEGYDECFYLSLNVDHFPEVSLVWGAKNIL